MFFSLKKNAQFLIKAKVFQNARKTHITQVVEVTNAPKAVHGGDAKPLVEQDTSTPLVCHHKMYHELPGESVGFRIAPAHYP